MESIPQALAHTQERISRACEACGRPPMGVQLLAVSKTQPWQAVAQAARAGQRAFGENYVQEGIDKIQQLRRHLNPDPSVSPRGQADSSAPLEWHLIGPLQAEHQAEVAAQSDWFPREDPQEMP